MIKRMAGRVACMVRPQCRYERAVFILGHMRCGSTALSNVLCGHPEVSGYGEAHIRYGDRSALGILTLNQQRRRALRPQSRYLFDKILHSRYDLEPDPGFLQARAIFLFREPVRTIISIRNLFQSIGSHEYSTDTLAADYYEERLNSLMASWARFPPSRRLGFTHDMLTANPDAGLGAISAMLELDPPLANQYRATTASQAPGAGDPLASHRHSSIVRVDVDMPDGAAAGMLEIHPTRVERLGQIFREFRKSVTQT